MKNYHINSQGTPSVCTASEKACPFENHGAFKSVVAAFKWASEIARVEAEEKEIHLRSLRKRPLNARELLRKAESGERVSYKELAKAFPFATVESTEWLEKQWVKPKTFGNLSLRAALNAFESGTWRSLGRD